MNSQELRALQESYGQVYELDEVSSADYTALAKTKKPRSKESIQARYHAKRLSKPEPETGKKSPRPYYPGGRKGMTQSDRDWSRGADEYGHSGYDGEGGGGSLPKGKKLERQKKTGVSESFDLYDIILSHLLDEGYADTEQAAEAIMVNMSEDWRESIAEGIAGRAANAVGHQRAGTLGDDDEIRKNQDATSASIGKMKRGSVAKVTPTLPGV